MKKVLYFTMRYMLSFPIIIYTYSLGVFSSKRRNLIYKICEYSNLTFRTNIIKPNLDFIPFVDIIDNNSVTIYEPVSELGNVSAGELAIINGIILKE